MRIGQDGKYRYLYVTVREIIGAVKSVTKGLKDLKDRNKISQLGDNLLSKLETSYGDMLGVAKKNLTSSVKSVVTPVLKLITLDEMYQKGMRAYQTLKPIVETVARLSGAWTAPGNFAEIAEIATGIATQYIIEIAMSAYVSLKSKVLSYEIKVKIGTVEVIEDINKAIDIVTDTSLEETNPAGNSNIFSDLMDDSDDRAGGKPDNFIIDTVGLAFTLEIEDKGTIAGSKENGLYYIRNSEFVKYTDGKFKRETGLDDNLNNATRPADYNDEIICVGKTDGGIIYTENWKDKNLENFNWTVAKLNEEPLQFYGTELNELNYDIKTLNKEAYIGDKYINTVSYDMWKCVESGEISSWQWERRVENDINDSNLLRTISIDTLSGTISSTDECTTDIEERRVIKVNGSIGNKISVDRNKVYRFSCLFNGTLSLGSNYVSDGWCLLVCYYSCNEFNDGKFNDNGFYKIDKYDGLTKTSGVSNRSFSDEFIDFSNVVLNGSLYEIRFDELSSDYPTLEEIYSGLTTNRFRGIKTNKTYYNYDIVLNNGNKYIFIDGNWKLYDTVKTYDSPYGSNILSKNWLNLPNGSTANLPNKRLKYSYNIKEISQDVELVKDKRYIFSCYAKGTILNFSYNDRTEIITLSDKWEKYSKAFVAKTNDYNIKISGTNTNVAGLKLEEVKELQEEEEINVNDENIVELQSLKSPKGELIGQYGKLENKFYKWNGLEWEYYAVLPNDSVLHYSFDEIPDTPDGENIISKNKDFDTNDLYSIGSAEIDNDCLKITNSVDSKYVGFRIKSIDNSNFKNAVVKIKLFVKNKNNTIKVRLLNHENDTELFSKDINTYEWVELTAELPSTANNPWIGMTLDIDDFFIIESLYIGDATYSTPIIDNSGNGNHIYNAKGIVENGISGKCFKANYLEVDKNLQNFTFSCWIKNDNKWVHLVGNEENDILKISNGKLIIDNKNYYDDLIVFDRTLSEEEILGLYLSKGNTEKNYTNKDYLIDLYDNDNLITVDEKKSLLKNWLDIYNKEKPETLSLETDGEFSTLVKEAQEVGFSLSNDYVENFIKSVETIRILLWDKEKGILNNLNENYNLEISLDEHFKNYRDSYNILKAVIKKQTIGITDNILIVQDNELSAITKSSKITNNITVYKEFEEVEFDIVVNDYNGFSYVDNPISIVNNSIIFDASKVEFNNTQIEINYKITIGEYERYITQSLYLYDEIYSLKAENLVLKKEGNNLLPVKATVNVYKESEKLEEGDFTIEAYENNILINTVNDVKMTISTDSNYPILFKLFSGNMLLDQLFVNILNDSMAQSTAWVNKETEKTKMITDANVRIDYISYLNDNKNKKSAFVALSNEVSDEHEVLDVYYSNDGKCWTKSYIDLDVDNYVYNKIVKKS